MITVEVRNKRHSVSDIMAKLGWKFLYNHRGVPDRVVDRGGHMVAFNLTRNGVFKLEFPKAAHALPFIQSLEDTPHE
jgi:hypothetical protein